MGRIVAFADSATAPVEFPIAPAAAIAKAVDRAGMSLADISAFEINEAFSVVALANVQLLNLDAGLSLSLSLCSLSLSLLSISLSLLSISLSLISLSLSLSLCLSLSLSLSDLSLLSLSQLK